MNEWTQALLHVTEAQRAALVFDEGDVELGRDAWIAVRWHVQFGRYEVEQLREQSDKGSFEALMAGLLDRELDHWDGWLNRHKELGIGYFV